MSYRSKYNKFCRAFPNLESEVIEDAICEFDSVEEFADYLEQQREDRDLMDSVMNDMTGGDEEMFEANMEGSYDD